MFDTRTGNPLSTQSAAAANLYCQAIDTILASESGAGQMLDQALELDKQFAMAAAARYFVAQDLGEQNAQEFKNKALQLAATSCTWEREHIAVLLGVMDQFAETREHALAYIAQAPADLLVISSLAGKMFFFDGPQKLHNVLALFESVAPALQEDWAFLARLGFAASEAGQYARARVLLEKALRMRPQSLYSIHGLAHMLHDEGATEESAQVLTDWLAIYGDGARQGQMYGHVQWHLALSEWQLGKRDKAVSRYQAYCAPGATTCGPILTLADCGGFLLRDYLTSGQACPLTEATQQHIERLWGMLDHPFVALHVAGLYASAEDLAGLKKCADVIAGKPAGANRQLSLALVSALSDFVQGNFAQASTTLAGLSAEMRIGIGGSRVERVLVDLIEVSSNANH